MYTLFIFLILSFATCVKAELPLPAINENANYLKYEPLQPIPLTISIDESKLELGEKLFDDPQLSHGNVLSCSSCHVLLQGGDDGLTVSVTNQGEKDNINAPTVFNSVFNFRQTWRGEFRTLALQAEDAIKNKKHGASNWPEVIQKLKRDKSYKKHFDDLYGGAITRGSILDALVVFEKSLITPNSRFDKYLRGNQSILTEDEKLGYHYFKMYGCVACHQGINIGGNVFQKFGLFDDYFTQRGNVSKADFGLYNVTGNESDRFVFRVPSLRNVSVTAPYLHDGSIDSLNKVVKIMARYQLGTTINDDHVNKIELFLTTLTGEYKGVLLEEGGQ